jgi:hypothetical protein
MSGARRREAAAILLLLVVLAAFVVAFVEERRPDEADRIVEQVMRRLGGEGAPSGVASPDGTGGPAPVPATAAPDGGCTPVTVVDDYGFEVPISICDPSSG